MKIVRYDDQDFSVVFKALRERAALPTEAAEQAVREIVAEVRSGGDAALKRLTMQFDGHDTLMVDPADILNAHEKIDPDVWESLKLARDRIERFHRHQVQESWLTPHDREPACLGAS